MSAMARIHSTGRHGEQVLMQALVQMTTMTTLCTILNSTGRTDFNSTAKLAGANTHPTTTNIHESAPCRRRHQTQAPTQRQQMQHKITHRNQIGSGLSTPLTWLIYPLETLWICSTKTLESLYLTAILEPHNRTFTRRRLQLEHHPRKDAAIHGTRHHRLTTKAQHRPRPYSYCSTSRRPAFPDGTFAYSDFNTLLLHTFYIHTKSQLENANIFFFS